MQTDKELIGALEGYANDPMWADHAEVPRRLLHQAIARLRALTAEPDEAMVEQLFDDIDDHCYAANDGTGFLGYEAKDIIRAALAAAPRREGWQPRETTKLEALARNAAVYAVDAIHGYTVEFSSHPADHARQYDIAERAIYTEMARVLAAAPQEGE